MSPLADKQTGVSSKAGCRYPGCPTKGYFKTDYCIRHRAVFCVDCRKRFSPHVLGNDRCRACTTQLRAKQRNVAEEI